MSKAKAGFVYESAPGEVDEEALARDRLYHDGLHLRDEAAVRYLVGKGYDEKLLRKCVDQIKTKKNIADLRGILQRLDTRERMSALKNAKKQGMPVLYLGFVHGLTAELAQSLGVQDLPTLMKLTQERLQVLNMAHTDFQRGHMFDHERSFQTLYDDIVRHERVWFEAIFADDRNNVYPERCSGIIGTLCSIRRQRGNWRNALELMPLYERVLGRYVDMTSRCQSALQHRCCRNLVYKKNAIKINALMQKGDLKACAVPYREAIRYELEENYGHEDQNFAWVLQMVNPRSRVGADQLDKVSDKELIKILKRVSQRGAQTTTMQQVPESPLVVTRPCARPDCSKTEAMRGDFKQCSGCKGVVYCGRGCQKADWSQHKAACRKNKRKHKNKAAAGSGGGAAPAPR